MVRKTRKAKKAAAKAMTVPQLRRAFEHMDGFVAKKGTDVDAFRKEWKKIFGKEVSRVAAEDYLKFVKTKKSQRGGALALSPAPLGYDLRAGTDTPYGSFNKYVGDGFGFANVDSVAAVCGRENITPKLPVMQSPVATLPADLGSNKVGGGRRKTRKQKGGASAGWLAQFLNNGAEALQRPVAIGKMDVPGAAVSAQMLAKGYPTGEGNLFASPRPEIPAFEYPTPGTTYGAYVSPSSRIV